MREKNLKNRLGLAVGFVVSFACSVCLLAELDGGSKCWAVADIPNGTAVGTTKYTVNDVITNWNQLEGLLSKYGTIYMSGAYIRDNNYAHYVHLGDETGATTISRIIWNYPLELYPQKILPAYNVSTGKFLASHTVRGSSPPSGYYDYIWSGKLAYVYDDTRDNCVVINHGVLDENGLILLPYTSKVESVDEIDVTKNTVARNNLNSPERNSAIMKIAYSGVQNGGKSIGSTKFSYSFEYWYKINAEFNSTLKESVDVMVLGGIDVKAEDEDGAGIAGAKFCVYEDAECTEPAKRYDGNSWESVDVIETGSDGKLSVTNLMPGKYYVKEVAAADGYENNASVDEVVVPENTPDLSLDTNSGEGDCIKINKENVVLDPEWETNTWGVEAPFKENKNYTETVYASSYNDGGDLFIRAGGDSVKFESAADVNRLESMSKLNNEKYTVAVGSISETFDTLSGALAYVNSELIGEGLLDEDNAQDHVTLSGDNLIYYCEENTVQAGFVETEIQDIPPTGVDYSMYAIPMTAMALLGLCCLMII